MPRLTKINWQALLDQRRCERYNRSNVAQRVRVQGIIMDDLQARLERRALWSLIAAGLITCVGLVGLHFTLFSLILSIPIGFTAWIWWLVDVETVKRHEKAMDVIRNWHKGRPNGS